jgi:hypothetical protein
MFNRLAIFSLFISLTLMPPLRAEDVPKPTNSDMPATEVEPVDELSEETSDSDNMLPVIADLGTDLELFKQVIDGEDDEKLSKRFSRIKKKKSEDDVETLKQDVMQSESAQETWRTVLREAFGLEAKILALECPPLEEVKQQIAAEHTTRLQQKYPPSKMLAMEKQALNRYPTVKIGDRVTVRLRTGRQVTGVVNRLDGAEATVGSTMIPLQDLDPRFHVAAAKRNRRAHVQKNYYEKRKAFEALLREKLPSFVHKRNGYVMYEDQWTPAKELAQRIDDRIAYLAIRGEEVKVEREERIATIKTRATQIGIGVAVLAVLIVLIAIFARKKK